MLIFHQMADLAAAEPTDLGATDWITVGRASLEDFASATRYEAGNGDTVPPFLLLSLTNRFLPDLLKVPAASSGINYGADLVRFGAPVRASDRLRARAFLMEVAEVSGGLQTRVQIRLEVEGADEPACVVESLSRWLA